MSNHRDPTPNWLDSKYMQTILQSHFKNPNLEVEAIEVTPGSKVGDNYACQVLRVNVKIKGGDDLPVIAKLTPDTEALKRIEEQNVFDVEGRFYAHLLPLLRKATENVKGMKTFSPECYHVDFGRKAFFMEDLKAKNYRLQPRGKWLDKKQTLLTLEALASMHGASLRAVEKDPTLKEKFTKTIWNGERNGLIGPLVDNYMVAIEKNMDKYRITEEQRAKLRNLGARVQKENFKIAEFNPSSFNVMCHGDAWLNNMMFHYDVTEQADNVVLFDYQIVNYNSIAIDLNYFIFMSVAPEVIVDDLDLLLETYSKKLKEVAPNNLNVSLEVVRKEFFDRLFYGAALCFAFRPIIIQDEPFDLDDIMSGKCEDRGFRHPLYIEALHKLLPIFEAAGAI